jgi:hypothetical protein
VPTLLRNSHFVLERYDAPAFVRLARTAEPLTTLAQPEGSLLACRAALGELDSGALGILIDWRLSPQAAASDAIEQAAVRDIEAFAAQFACAAVLLLTAAAPAWSSSSVKVFRDEEAAIAYVSATSC